MMTKLVDLWQKDHIEQWLKDCNCMDAVFAVSDNTIWAHSKIDCDYVKAKLAAHWWRGLPFPTVDWPRDEDSKPERTEIVKDKAPTTRVVREIFSPDVEGRDYYHVVSPQDEGIDIAFHEEDHEGASLTIPLDVVEAVAYAMLACAKEMRAQEKADGL